MAQRSTAGSVGVKREKENKKMKKVKVGGGVGTEDVHF